MVEFLMSDNKACKLVDINSKMPQGQWCSSNAKIRISNVETLQPLALIFQKNGNRFF